MRLLIAFVLALFTMLANTSFADSITCALNSGNEVSSVSIDLNGALDEYALSESVYDLSFNMIADCDGQNCRVDITIDSSILEDEAGSTGFEFERNGKAAEVFSEPLENAPDNRSYKLSCTYNS